jgi:hypothetical protein
VDDGRVFRLGASRPIHVTQQITVAAAPKHHILLDMYVEHFVNRHCLRVYVRRVSRDALKGDYWLILLDPRG